MFKFTSLLLRSEHQTARGKLSLFLAPMLTIGRFIVAAQGECVRRLHTVNRVGKRSVTGMIGFIVGHSLPLWQSQLLDVSILGLVCALALIANVRFRHPISLLTLALTLGLLSATVRFQWHADAILPSAWERKEMAVVVKVDGLPKYYGQDVSFTAQVIGLDSTSDLRPNRILNQRLLLNCYRCPLGVKPNQIWQLSVRLKRPHGYASAGAFDYEKYLFRQQIVAKGYVRLKSLNTLLIDSHQGVDHWRLSIKSKVLSVLRHNDNAQLKFSDKNPNREPLADSGAATILALTIGDKTLFTRAQREWLQASGLSHLFAISGLHIGLIFTAVMFVTTWTLNVVPRLFEYCPRPYLCLPPALFCALIYAALAGFSVSTQRALVMLCVFVGIRMSMRNAPLFKVLLIAASVLLAVDPFSVLDTGFWLSCSAVAVIAAVAWRDPDANALKLQPALWLGMMPITVVFFGHVSLVSPVLNLIAVPVFCLGLIPMTLLAVFFNQLGVPMVADSMLNFLNHVYQWVFIGLQWITSHSWVALPMPEFGLWQWAAFVFLVLGYLCKQRSVFWLAPLFLLTFSVQVFAKRVDSNLIKLTLLDVGQGLSLVVQTPYAVTVYDTGPRYGSGFTAAQAVLLPYLRQQGINYIDRLIISHADNDHIGGYDTLVKHIGVGQVLTSRVDKLPTAQECLAGQFWQEGATMFSIISPQPETPNGSNNRSCVLRIVHGETTVLITGDIEKQVERFLLRQGADLLADIVLVPHQGSKTSSTEGFINAVRPKTALVAAGYQNHYGHPHPNVVKRYHERGIQLLSTIDAGTIEIDINSRTFTTSAYRDAHKRFWR